MRTVMVVDDEPFIRVSMASLRAWTEDGFDFRYEAGNGRQALELLARHPEIDIVLLDLSMPVMDGIGFLEALPVAQEGPAVVVLSAHDNYPLVRQAFTLGVRDYLLKTEVDGDSLLAILNKVAGSSAPPAGRAAPPSEPLLADLLAGRAPEAALGLDFPVTLWRIGILDFEVIASRYGKTGLVQFQELYLRSVRQLLEKRGGGQAALAGPDVIALLAGPQVLPELLAPELKESLERYLSIRLEIHHSPPLTGPGPIPGAWEELERARPGASRIVLLTKRYLRDHWARSVIPLEELASHVGVSRNHLSWEFARETGETITDYLARLRVEEACRLLVGSTLKVYEIAEKVGYSNVEHFCRVFKRITGTSPNRWASSADPQVFRFSDQ